MTTLLSPHRIRRVLRPLGVGNSLRRVHGATLEVRSLDYLRTAMDWSVDPDLDFDHLLFAHGEPVIGGGKQDLRAFCEA